MGADLCGVVSNTKNRLNSDFADLRPICDAGGIDFYDTNDINSKETVEWINDRKPDIIFCFGWSKLIKAKVLKLAPMGVLGFHPSLLPKNRGRHPIIWALALGLEETGSTFFFMDEGADSGDILSQRVLSIYYGDDAASLYERISLTALKQIEEFLPSLTAKTHKVLKQNHELSNTWRKRGAVDGQIDFRMTSRAIYDLVRALRRPYVGAHLVFQGNNVKVWSAKEVTYNDNNIEPGKVLKIEENCVLVKSWDAAVLISEHEFNVLPRVGEYL